MTVSIAIIVAMESERRHLDAFMPGWEPVDNAVWPLLRNNDVICISSGIGMVSAAAATEHAIGTYAPTMVMNFGCAGAHDRELFPGDVVIGDRLIHQGRMRFAPNGEIIYREDVFDTVGETKDFSGTMSDPTLREAAEQLATGLTLPEWPVEIRLPNQTDRSPIVRSGTVSSADIWLQSKSMIDARNERTGSLCEDMEAAGIAQVCRMYAVPFLTVKDISNNELLESTAFDDDTWSVHAAELGKRSAMVICGVVEKLRQIGGLRRLRYS